jgi:hypothetical protein
MLQYLWHIINSIIVIVIASTTYHYCHRHRHYHAECIIQSGNSLCVLENKFWSRQRIPPIRQRFRGPRWGDWNAALHRPLPDFFLFVVHENMLTKFLANKIFALYTPYEPIKITSTLFLLHLLTFPPLFVRSFSHPVLCLYGSCSDPSGIYMRVNSVEL